LISEERWAAARERERQPLPEMIFGAFAAAGLALRFKIFGPFGPAAGTRANCKHQLSVLECDSDKCHSVARPKFQGV